jgi:hypothetical protein
MATHEEAQALADAEAEQERKKEEAFEQLVMDCWRSADFISIGEVEEIRTQTKAIKETIDLLERALERASNGN